MIILIHRGTAVDRVEIDGKEVEFTQLSMTSLIFELARKYPDQVIVWCESAYETHLNRDAINGLLHHKKMILHFDVCTKTILNHRYGYVDSNILLTIDKNIRQFSWQISESMGAIHAELLNTLRPAVRNFADDFAYAFHSLAFRASTKGLICYSEPNLLKPWPVTLNSEAGSNFSLFRFVRQHKGLKWACMLFFNICIFEKRFLVFPFMLSLFYWFRTDKKILLESIQVVSSKKISAGHEVDVIIPTFGRTKYVISLLQQLSVQSKLPKKVIIVEQNPVMDSISELASACARTWPFIVDHIFTHRTGVCNARNLALSRVESEWVFMCDDDNSFERNLIMDVFENIAQYAAEAVLTGYPQRGEKLKYQQIHQTAIFGSGNSFVKSSALSGLSFGLEYEYSYGEDFDFGMQLRMAGTDILYFPFPEITHLKAPSGGFRIRPQFLWDDEVVTPRPSPAILLNFCKHKSASQMNGYQLVYFSTQIWKQFPRSPFRIIRELNNSWNVSLKWAKHLQGEVKNSAWYD